MLQPSRPSWISWISFNTTRRYLWSWPRKSKTSDLQMVIPQDVSAPKLRIRSLCLFYLPIQQKLAGSQLVKKFPAFDGTQRFITAFTRVRHPPRQLLTFRNMAIFLRWGVLAPRPSPAGRPQLVGCPRLLIQYIRSDPPHLQADPRSSGWGRAMPWWQGPT